MERRGLIFLLELSRQVGTRKALEVFFLVAHFRVASLELAARCSNDLQALK